MENILVIEDDLMFCKLLSNYLNKNGYMASQAIDGKSAKEQLAERTFDSVLIDYRLPDTNGMDLVKWIVEKQKGIKIVMMSRTLNENIQKEAEEYGVSGFLNKPFNPSELIEILKK